MVRVRECDCVRVCDDVRVDAAVGVSTVVEDLDADDDGSPLGSALEAVQVLVGDGVSADDGEAVPDVADDDDGDQLTPANFQATV